MPKNIIGTTLSTTYHGSSNHKIFGTAGEQINFVENVAVSSSMGMTPSTLTAYGISYITSSAGGTMPTSGVGTVTLPAPRVGVKKTIILNSTAAGGTVDICLSTGAAGAGGLLGTTAESSTGATYILFSTLPAGPQVVNLVGLTTSLWAVQSVTVPRDNSTVVDYSWGSSLGVRSATAGRTT